MNKIIKKISISTASSKKFTKVERVVLLFKSINCNFSTWNLSSNL